MDNDARDERVAPWRDWLVASGILTLSTLAALALRPVLASADLAMIFLLGVVVAALRCRRSTAVTVSILSVAAFDFFCVPPYYTFAVDRYEYLITLAGTLIVALVISTQTARIRQQAAQAGNREARTQVLARLSSRLASETRVFEAARGAAMLAEEVLRRRVVIFLPDNDAISFRRRTADQLPVPASEEPVAAWVFEHGRPAGKGAEMHSGATALYVPLRAARSTRGVMAMVPGAIQSLTEDQRQLLEVFASQTALAIDRILSQSAEEASRIDMQTEQMRSSLLSAVSHDLRTPLASITGAATTLRSQHEKLSPATRDELLDSIAEEAERLGRLVRNLLDMTRFETGGVQLRSDLYPLEEIVGAALQRVERQLRGRAVETHIPGNLPFVRADDVLLGQVVINLLENAAKYTPKDSPIEIQASVQDDLVVLEVCDRGPGLEPGEEDRLFDKFYRGKSDGARGAGLGLAICRAILQAHGGRIEAANRTGGGAVFRCFLPLESATTPVEA